MSVDTEATDKAMVLRKDDVDALAREDEAVAIGKQLRDEVVQCEKEIMKANAAHYKALLRLRDHDQKELKKLRKEVTRLKTAGGAVQKKGRQRQNGTSK